METPSKASCLLPRGGKRYPRVRYEVLPVSRAAHTELSDFPSALALPQFSNAGHLGTIALRVGWVLEHDHLELVVSLPQHSGCSGNEERSHPPPSACTSVTASTIRRPRIFTAVTSSERAAL
jgi:hypothetical protein